MPKSNNLRQYTADLLRSIELSGFLACAGCKLANHIFVSIAQNINFLRGLYTKVNIVQCKKHIADERVFIICCFSQFRRSQINVREQSAKILFTILSQSAVFYTLQRAFQHRKNIFFPLDSLNYGRKQELRFNEVAYIFQALVLNLFLQFRCIRIGHFP